VPPLSRPSDAPTPTLVRQICDRRIAWPALKVAFLVGIVLNAINNSDHLLRGDAINWWQFALNFVVPFCVSSYSAARSNLRRAGDD
jgi:hypothetical protein